MSYTQPCVIERGDALALPSLAWPANLPLNEGSKRRANPPRVCVKSGTIEHDTGPRLSCVVRELKLLASGKGGGGKYALPKVVMQICTSPPKVRD